MANYSMQSLKLSLNALDEYFRNVDTTNAGIKQRIDAYRADRDQFTRDFNTITLDQTNTALLNQSIERLLRTLNIPSNQWNRYLHQSLTVYDLLLELRERPDLGTNTKLREFIALLDQQHNKRWGNILLGSVMLSTIMLSPFYIYGFTALQQALSVLLVVGEAGIIYAVAVALYTAYDTSTSVDSNTSYFQLFKDNAFAIANNVFTILAWSLMTTAVVSTPIVLMFFVLADVVMVVKELVSLAYLSKPSFVPGMDVQQHTRELANYEQRKREVMVKLVAAVVLTVIIVLWCFPPSGILLASGGLFLAAAAMLGMLAVHLAKHHALDQIKTTMRTELRERFETVEAGGLIVDVPAQSPDKRPGICLCFNLFGVPRKKSDPDLLSPEIKSEAIRIGVT